MSSRINHVAVFVSALVFFVLGWLWYTALFGHAWMALTGHTQTSTGAMGNVLIATFILQWLLAYVIAIALADTTNPNPMRHGVEFGIFMGIGIFGTMLGVNYVNEGHGFELWAINTGYVVVGMALMGGIMGAWRKKAVAAAV